MAAPRARWQSSAWLMIGRAEGQGVLHGAAVELGVHHALAVVGEGDAAGLGLLGHLGELRALEVLRVTAPIGYTRTTPSTRALGQDVVGDGAVVVDGERVGHAADGGEAARRRRARAAWRSSPCTRARARAGGRACRSSPGHTTLPVASIGLRRGGRLEPAAQPGDAAVGRSRTSWTASTPFAGIHAPGH